MKINAKTEALKKISRKLDFIAVIGSDVYSNELNADFDLPFFFSIYFFLFWPVFVSLNVWLCVAIELIERVALPSL